VELLGESEGRFFVVASLGFEACELAVGHLFEALELVLQALAPERGFTRTGGLELGAVDGVQGPADHASVSGRTDLLREEFSQGFLVVQEEAPGPFRKA
jgi:hypothetical protein